MSEIISSQLQCIYSCIIFDNIVHINIFSYILSVVEEVLYLHLLIPAFKMFFQLKYNYSS